MKNVFFLEIYHQKSFFCLKSLSILYGAVVKSGPINSWLWRIKWPIFYLHALFRRALSRRPLWYRGDSFLCLCFRKSWIEMVGPIWPKFSGVALLVVGNYYVCSISAQSRRVDWPGSYPFSCSRCYKTFFGGNLDFPKIKK